MTAKPPPLQFHRHIIRATPVQQGWKGGAFRGDRLDGGYLVSRTYDDLIATLTDRLKTARRMEISARGPDGFPTVGWVRDAIGVIKISKSQQLMLDAHLAAPERILTATQLAHAGGYSRYVSANSQYGNLGRLLAEEMEWQPLQRPDASNIWTSALADDADRNALSDDRSAQFRWRMRDNVAAALVGPR